MPLDGKSTLQIRDDMEGGDTLLAEVAWTWGEHRAAMFRYFARRLQESAPDPMPKWAQRLLMEWGLESLR